MSPIGYIVPGAGYDLSVTIHHPGWIGLNEAELSLAQAIERSRIREQRLNLIRPTLTYQDRLRFVFGGK